MNKMCVAGAVVLGLCMGDAALAAPSVAGKTFSLSGKLGGNVSVSCKVGGSRSQKLPGTRKDLAAQISFNEDGTFSWSNDTLGIGTISGEWTQKRSGKLDLDFDDPSAFSYIWRYGEFYSTNLPGGSTSISPLKYAFGGKLNAKGTALTLEESGGFKIKASASYGGSSNACSYKLRVSRTYKGKGN